jgi:hypothetical protein
MRSDEIMTGQRAFNPIHTPRRQAGKTGFKYMRKAELAPSQKASRSRCGVGYTTFNLYLHNRTIVVYTCTVLKHGADAYVTKL